MEPWVLEPTYGLISTAVLIFWRVGLSQQKPPEYWSYLSKWGKKMIVFLHRQFYNYIQFSDNDLELAPFLPVRLDCLGGYGS